MTVPDSSSPGGPPDAARQRWLNKIEGLSPSELDGVFLRAVTEHDVTGVTVLLEVKSEFFTPELGRGLQIAAEKGFCDLVSLFLGKGAPPDTMAGLPLRLAVENGHRDAAWLLVKAGADEHRGEGNLVNMAARANQTGMMEWLFARGVRGDLMNALNAAGKHGHEAVVDLILERLKPGEADHRAFTALYSAVEGGHDGIARKLIDRGFHKLGDTEMLFDAVVRNMDAPLLEFFLERAPPARLPLRRALMLASGLGKVDCVRVLLNEGAPPAPVVASPESVAALFNDAAAQDTLSAGKRLGLLYPDGYTLEKLRTVSEDGTNGFLLMTLAGRWEELKNYIMTHRDEPLQAADFSTANRLGRNVLGILGRTGKLDSLFDPALWEGRSAQTLASTLRCVPARFHADIKYAERAAEANRRVLDELMMPRRKRGPGPGSGP